MKRSMVFALFATVCLAFASAAHAVLIHFETSLSGANENPAIVTPGNGTASVDIDTVSLMMTVNATFADLLGLTTAAHIHCCQNPPTNAQVATQVPTFTGFPLGVMSGSFQQMLDMSLASSYNPAFITDHGGTVPLAFADLLAGMLAGQSYFNIHTELVWRR